MLDVSAQAAPDVVATAWRARLELDFAYRDGRTIMAHRRHSGPLMVQRPFYPDGPVCHTYILHPPGGVVASDRLDTRVHVRRDASVLLTTPASGKLYRSAGATAVQSQVLRVDAGAALEWLPQETICFDGARARQSTRIELETGARVLAWELTGLGRPGAGERFEHGRLAQSLELMRDGLPLLVERTTLDPGDALMRARWGLGGANAFATLIAYPVDDQALAAARSVAAGSESLSLTCVDGVAVVRFLGDGLDAARRQVEALWRALRPVVLGREAVAPRVWAT